MQPLLKSDGTDSWRLHVKEIPCITDAVSMSSCGASHHTASEKWKHELTSACHSLRDSTGLDIGRDHWFSIQKSNGDSISISSPCIESLDPWRPKRTQSPSSPDAISVTNTLPTPFIGHQEKQELSSDNYEIMINSKLPTNLFLSEDGRASKMCALKPSPSLDNYDPWTRSVHVREQSSITDVVFIPNPDPLVRDERCLNSTAGWHEGISNHHDNGSDRPRYSNPECASTPPPYHDAGNSAAEPPSWTSIIAPACAARIGAANPPRGKRKPPAEPAAGEGGAPARRGKIPRDAAAAARRVGKEPAAACPASPRRARCEDAGRRRACPHGRAKSQCGDCGGGSFCAHGRRRSACKACGGSLFCPHGRQKSRCRDCGGVSICPHGRRRSQCRECGGAGICGHGRRRSTCKACGGASVCAHGRLRARCADCRPRATARRP